MYQNFNCSSFSDIWKMYEEIFWKRLVNQSNQSQFESVFAEVNWSGLQDCSISGKETVSQIFFLKF